jgi:hypothetical protein
MARYNILGSPVLGFGESRNYTVLSYQEARSFIESDSSAIGVPMAQEANVGMLFRGEIRGEGLELEGKSGLRAGTSPSWNVIELQGNQSNSIIGVERFEYRVKWSQ